MVPSPKPRSGERGRLDDFVPSGTPAHDAAAADRRWRTLLELLDRTLKAHP